MKNVRSATVSLVVRGSMRTTSASVLWEDVKVNEYRRHEGVSRNVRLWVTVEPVFSVSIETSSTPSPPDAPRRYTDAV